jgi:hypothetical protein
MRCESVSALSHPLKASLAAPEFHAALVVRVEDPHTVLSPKGSGWSQLSPEAILLQGGEDKGEAWKEGECEKKEHLDHILHLQAI